MRFYPVACHSDTRRRATTSEQYRLTHTHRQQAVASKVREFGAAISRHCRPREDWRRVFGRGRARPPRLRSRPAETVACAV